MACGGAFAALASADDDGDETSGTGSDVVKVERESVQVAQRGAEESSEVSSEQHGPSAALEDLEDAEYEVVDCDDEEPMDVQALRWDRGVTISVRGPAGHCGITDAGSWEPVASFDALLKRGAPRDLVDRCRRCCGSGAVRPTAIQAECWGLLLTPAERPSSASGNLGANQRRVDIEALILKHGLENLHIHVPVPDSDSDWEEAGPQSGANAPAVSSSAPACVVRDDLDVIGIAPTGSGKTLAFVLPLLADGLCAEGRPVHKMQDIFDRFVSLFPQSYDLDKPGHASLLSRFEKMNSAGQSKVLAAAISQVAEKAEQCTNKAVAEQWRRLRLDAGRVGLIVPTAVVLLPTRELALQVAEVASAIGASSAAVIGGVDPASQRERLLQNPPAMLIATPGRLRALCGECPSSAAKRRGLSDSRGRGASASTAQSSELAADQSEAQEVCMSLGAVTRLVMDEGDRLLDEGFTEDVTALARLAAQRRQAMLFSATWSSEAAALASVLRPSVAHISVAGIPRTIVQDVEVIPKAARGKRLRELLHEFGHSKKVLVFVLFKKEAKELARMLAGEGFSAVALQGDMSQSARSAALQRFRDGTATVLVATDVAARGLDIGGVNHVVNFSLGLSMDSYVHRIGRCGRAGRHGTAVTFVTDGDERHAAPLQRLLAQCGQQVPPGLKEMAASYERAAADGVRLQVKHSGAKGEVKFVAKT